MIAISGFILFIIVLTVQVIAIFSKKREPITPFLLLLISLLLIGELVRRSLKIEFFALTNTFEALLFFSAIIALIMGIYRLKSGVKALLPVYFIGSFVAFILLAISSSPLVPSEIKPPIPALQSGWLVIHVALSFIGESFFAFSFAVAIYYLLSRRDAEQKRGVEKLIYTSIAIGYPIFTAGALIFGAIWAHYAWGRFWSWDPKETFAFITWLVYTIYLHLRLTKKVGPRKTALVSILGFALTLFTFFGVNYLLPSLHSYR